MQDHIYALFTKEYHDKIIARCNCDKKVKKVDVEKEFKKVFKVKKAMKKKRPKKNNIQMFRNKYLSREEIKILLYTKQDSTNDNELSEKVHISHNNFCKKLLKNDKIKMVSFKISFK